MMNRLHCVKQMSLLILFFFISFFKIDAQSCPDSTGVSWGITLNDPQYWSDTVFINGFCDNELEVPTLAFSFFDGLMNTDYTYGPFGPSAATISPAMYSFGDTIPGGEVINITYHLQAQHNTTMVFFRDTFCLEITFLDTIPPTFIGQIDEAGNYMASLPPETITPPVTCPSDYPDTIRLVAEDCGLNIDTVLFTETPTPDPGMFCPGGGGMVMRTWTVIDLSGNEKKFTQFITIIPDIELPTLTTSPISDTVTCVSNDFDQWLMNQVTTVMSPGNAMDNCGILTINYGIVSGDTTDLYCDEIIVEFNVLDSCGSTATFPVSYVVTDNVAPLITGLPVMDTILLSCGDLVPDPPAVVTASDDCDTSMINVVFTADTIQICTHSFEITRIWSAVDACGNVNSFTQRIIMSDNDAPTYTLPADKLFESVLPTDPCYFDTDISNTGNISLLIDNCTAPLDIVLDYGGFSCNPTFLY